MHGKSIRLEMPGIFLTISSAGAKLESGSFTMLSSVAVAGKSGFCGPIAPSAYVPADTLSKDEG